MWDNFESMMAFNVMEPNAFGMSVMQKEETTDEVINSIKQSVIFGGMSVQEATDRAFEKHNVNSSEDIELNRVRSCVNFLIMEGYPEYD